MIFETIFLKIVTIRVNTTVFCRNFSLCPGMKRILTFFKLYARSTTNEVTSLLLLLNAKGWQTCKWANFCAQTISIFPENHLLIRKSNQQSATRINTVLIVRFYAHQILSARHFYSSREISTILQILKASEFLCLQGNCVLSFVPPSLFL